MFGQLLRDSIRKINVNPFKFYHNKSDCHVTVPQGRMRGKVCSTPCGKQYYSFEGIPYAKPPVGPLRFRDPQKVDSWSGVLDATQPGNKCVQLNPFTRSIEGSEDCLYLNVYTPVLPDEKKQNLPVLFFVHGGNLYTGCGHMYRPDSLIRHDAILVTTNYRLNIFGFLDLETQHVPGNAGLKDVATALKWVKDNIEHFNGDSKNITGMGESVGAIITTFLTASKMTEGILNKIIAMSTPISYPMISEDPVRRAKDIATHLGRDLKNVDEIEDLFRKSTPEDLLKATMKAGSGVNKYSVHSFLQVSVEKKYDNVEPFLNDYPLKILEDNFTKVPAIMSLASHESAYFITPPSGEIKFIKDIMKFVPSHALKDKDAAQLIEMERKIKDLYFQDKEIGPSTLLQYLDMLSDFLVTNDMVHAAELLSGHNFYFFRFAYGNSRIMKRLGVKGATHSDVLRFLFYSEKRRNTFSEEDMRIVDLLSEALCHFARTGVPRWTGQEIPWPSYKKDDRLCLNIGDTISCIPLPEYDRYSKLNNILNTPRMPQKINE